METAIKESAWAEMVELIAEAYKPGQVIEHSELRILLGVKDPAYSEYGNIQDFLKARDSAQFEYMSLVQKLRKDLLFHHQRCLYSIFGVGYSFLDPKKQVRTAYEDAMKEVRKSMRDAMNIMTNVREDETHEQRAKDSDLIARMSMMKGMMGKIART